MKEIFYSISLKARKIFPGKAQGPVTWSQYNFIKLSFKEGIHNDFLGSLQNAMVTRAWERLSLNPSATSSSSSQSLVKIHEQIKTHLWNCCYTS